MKNAEPLVCHAGTIPDEPRVARGLEGARQLAKVVVEHPDYIDSQGNGRSFRGR